VRKSTSVRLGLLLAASALLLACEREKPQERRCVDDDGRFVDESMCSTIGEAARGPLGPSGPPSGATGDWGEADGRTAASRGGGFHFIWIPYGSYGGVGTYASGFVRPGSPGSGAPGAVSRGGFGATGAAHASPGATGTAAA
jgi:hypothetical protein